MEKEMRWKQKVWPLIFPLPSFHDLHSLIFFPRCIHSTILPSSSLLHSPLFLCFPLPCLLRPISVSFTPRLSSAPQDSSFSTTCTKMPTSLPCKEEGGGGERRAEGNDDEEEEDEDESEESCLQVSSFNTTCARMPPRCNGSRAGDEERERREEERNKDEEEEGGRDGLSLMSFALPLSLCSSSLRLVIFFYLFARFFFLSFPPFHPLLAFCLLLPPYCLVPSSASRCYPPTSIRWPLLRVSFPPFFLCSFVYFSALFLFFLHRTAIVRSLLPSSHYLSFLLFFILFPSLRPLHRFSSPFAFCLSVSSLFLCVCFLLFFLSLRCRTDNAHSSSTSS